MHIVGIILSVLWQIVFQSWPIILLILVVGLSMQYK